MKKTKFISFVAILATILLTSCETKEPTEFGIDAPYKSSICGHVTYTYKTKSGPEIEIAPEGTEVTFMLCYLELDEDEEVVEKYQSLIVKTDGDGYYHADIPVPSGMGCGYTISTEIIGESYEKILNETDKYSMVEVLCYTEYPGTSSSSGFKKINAGETHVVDLVTEPVAILGDGNHTLE